MLLFILGKFASLLPQRYRPWIQINASAAFASGIAQILLCLGLFIYRYLMFVQNNVFGGTAIELKAMQVGGETALSGSGLFVLAEYMIQPLTVVLVYFAFEGIVRATAAFVTGEFVPTLPLAIMGWLHGKIEEIRAERKLGKRVADEVEVLNSPDVKLRIDSCRPKRNWDHRITVFYGDELYEVADRLEAESPRRFVYLLRRKPENKLVRGTYHYHPEEVLLG